MAKARLLVPLSFFLFTSVPVAAQGQVQSSARYNLRGSVVNSVTGEPVRKASVEVNGMQMRHAFTGPDGQFQFEGLPAGGYSVFARKPGYMDPGSGGWSFLTQGSVTTGSGSVAFLGIGTINLGSDTAALEIKLAPQAKISGRVLDTDGEPVPNVNVQCLQQNIVSGHKRWQPAQATSTDDAGNFLLDNLPPGQALLYTQQQQVYPGLIADDVASRLIYRKQYYPNATEIGSAQAIDLNPGDDARADITVSSLRGTRVFFSVTPSQQWIQATLVDTSGDQVEAQTRPNVRAGGWILPSVPPGAWRLTVMSNSGEPLLGETAIEVGEADLRNVVVPLMSQNAVAPVTVSGGGSGAGNAAMPIRLISLSQSLNNSEYGAVQGPEPNGHLTIPGVTPGAYHVAVGSGSECVDSITSGSADLSHTDYVITAGSPPPPINIALRSDCATLDISLPAQQSNQPAVMPAAIVIVGGPSAAEPEVTYTAGSSSQTMKLSPGEYQVYAFSNLQNVEYANPDVLKNYTSQHVSLSPNQRATVRVELNAPGGSR